MEPADGKAIKRINAAPLCRSELVGDHKAGEPVEGLRNRLELAFEHRRLSSQGGGCVMMALSLGVFEQLTAVGLVRDSVGRDELERLLAAKPVPLDGAKQRLLIFARQGAEAVRDGGTDGALGELVLGLLRKLSADVEAPRDPASFPSEQAADLALRLSVLLQQRADHHGLIHGREAARRGIGEKQPPQVLLRACRPLDYHRDQLVALVPPGSQALVAVDDLVGPVVGGDHPDRQLGKIVDARP